MPGNPRRRIPNEDAPRDGRQLLGWASKQIPDLKGALIGYGKTKGLHFRRRGMDPAAGRGGVPVRPGAVGLDPIMARYSRAYSGPPALSVDTRDSS